VVETKLRCPFRDLVRARANRLITSIAQSGKIWEEREAEEYCDNWYGKEVSNVTRLGAVWDALKLLPCPRDEATIRKLTSCFQIETSNVMPTHPLAKFCYTSYPLQLNIGLTVSTQCCYGADLRLLVLGSRGAGSVDFSSKLARHQDSDADHFQNDLFPRLACCELSGNCVKYSVVRPPMLVPESDAEVQESCRIMSEVYAWEPYKTFLPPYARPDAIEEWAALRLNKSSLVPTAKLGAILEKAQVVRKRIQDKQDPYPAVSTSHIPTSKTTTSHESEETKHDSTTKHATPDVHSTKKPAESKGRSSESEEIDSAIATVLTAQVGKPSSKKLGGDLEAELKNFAEASGDKKTQGDKKTSQAKDEHEAKKPTQKH
jgi:hypothetical protein